MVWLLFIIVVLSLTYLGAKKGRFYWIYRIVLLLVLSLMTGLGSPVGQDHHAYVEMFYMFTQFSGFTDIGMILESYVIEPGYISLNVIGNMLHMSEPIFFIFLSILMNIGIVYCIYHFRYPVLAILVYVLTINYLQEVNLVRQSIAISIYIIAIMELMKGKFKLYYVLLFIAFLFHSTIATLIPFSILGYFDLNKYKKNIYYISFILWGFSIFVFAGVSTIPYLDSILQMFGDSRFSSYSSGSNDMGLGNVGFNFSYNLMFLFILLSMKKEVNLIKIWISIGVVLLNFNLPMTTRIALYFIVFIPLTCGEYIVENTYLRTPWVLNTISIYKVLIISYWTYKLLVNNILGNPFLGSKFYSL